MRQIILIMMVFGLGCLCGWEGAKQNPTLPSQSDIQRDCSGCVYCDTHAIEAYKRVFFGENQKDKYKTHKDLRPTK